MQLEDDIAKELAGIINGRFDKYSDQVKAIDARLIAVEAREPEKEDAPDDVVDEIAKAIALLAESPPLARPKDGQPLVVNLSSAARKIKTITTRRDGDGNLVARVVEDAG